MKQNQNERIQRISIRELDSHSFNEKFRTPHLPCILTEAIPLTPSWSLAETAQLIGDQHPLAVRQFGAGHIDQPEAWQKRGYCQSVANLTGKQFAAQIADGKAEREDMYLVADIAPTPAGRLLAHSFSQLSQKLNLELSYFGESINAWWGPTGHREQLHFDICDGTLWQLHGEKQISLFPPHQWENLYRFPFDSTMTYCFSQVLLKKPDFTRFPLLRTALKYEWKFRLRPGEILYIPACWAHEVTGVEAETKTGMKSHHILSVQRFWKTPMSKLADLPLEILGRFFQGTKLQEILQFRGRNLERHGDGLTL
jgi:hypothetical protein